MDTFYDIRNEKEYLKYYNDSEYILDFEIVF